MRTKTFFKNIDTMHNQTFFVLSEGKGLILNNYLLKKLDLKGFSKKKSRNPDGTKKNHTWVENPRTENPGFSYKKTYEVLQLISKTFNYIKKNSPFENTKLPQMENSCG